MPLWPSSLELLEARIAPATLVVTSTADSGLGSLRDILAQSNSTPAVTDTITFNLPAGSKITLASAITITDDVTINGLGAGSLFISGNNATQLFKIDDASSSAITVTLNGLSLVQAHSATPGGAIASAEYLTLNNCVVANCISDDSGGGIYHTSGSDNGHLVLNNTKIVNNKSGAPGGGVVAQTQGNIAILNSLIAGNTAATRGGGALLDELTAGSGDIYVVNSIITGNTATNGDAGGLSLNNRRAGPDQMDHTADDGRAIVYNSVITGNQAPGSGADGGGVQFIQGNGFVIGSMIKGNSAAGSGGGIAAAAQCESLLIMGSSLQYNFSTSTAVGDGGGGLFLATNLQTSFVATLMQTELVGNRAATGGAILQDGAGVTLNTTSFRYNAATGLAISTGTGGAIETHTTNGTLSPLSITITEFIGNTAAAEGGAVNVTGAGALSLNTVAFTGNRSSASGGGLQVIGGAPVILKNIAITGNVADARAGGMELNSSAPITVDSVLVTGNVSGSLGGGLAFGGLGLKSVTNAIIRDNIAGQGGGGIANNTSSLSLSNAIVTGNIAPSGGGLARIAGGTFTIGQNVTLAGNTSNDGLQTNF